MKAVLKWPGGETVFEGAELGDPRVSIALDRLARAGVSSGVSLAFESEPSDSVRSPAPQEAAE